MEIEGQHIKIPEGTAEDLTKSQAQIPIEINRKIPSEDLITMIQRSWQLLCKSEKFGEKNKEKRT